MVETKSLTFETKPELVTIDYVSDECVRISLHGDLAVRVDFENDVILNTKGNFTIAGMGVDIISGDNPICLDSLNSVIHLNSREAKLLQDDPKAIEERKLMQRKNFIMDKMEVQKASLEERIQLLENQIKELKWQV